MATKRDQERKIKYSDAKKVAKHHTESQEGGGCLRLPEGVDLYKVGKAGRFRFDIIPFQAKKDNPAVRSGQVEAGDYHWERFFYQHIGVGPENKKVACLLKNWGKPCPCCEAAAEFDKTRDRGDDASYQALKSMRPKARQMYLVLDRDTSQKPSIQVFECSWSLFGELLANKIDMATEKNGYDRFFHLDDGMTLDVKFTQETMGTSQFYKASTIEMVERAKAIPESILEDVPCLDDVLIRLDYAAMKKLITVGEEDEPQDDERPVSRRSEPDDDDRPVSRRRAEPEDDEDEPQRKPREEEATPKRRTKTAPKDEDEDEPSDTPVARKGLELGTVVLYEGERCSVIKINASETQVNLENCDSKEVHRSVDPDDCKIPKDDDEPAPKRKVKAAPKDDDEPAPKRKWPTKDADEDEDDKPKPRRRATRDDD